jgi:hypothetical protein
MSNLQGYKLFKYNYLQELPEDINILIYKYVYKNNYSIVLNELQSKFENRKHYNNLKYFLAFQEEPKLNLKEYLSQNINININRKDKIKNTEGITYFYYKNHLTSNNISKIHINKIKFASNVFLYLNKRIAQTFINFVKKSKKTKHFTYNIYIDENAEYFVLEYDRFFCCFAELYLMLLTFWQFIRFKLYEFLEVHKEACNIYISNLLNDDYDAGILSWYIGNMTDDILDKNLLKNKENAKTYQKIIKHRNYLHKTETFYMKFLISNNIDKYFIDNDTMIIQLKES